MYEEIYRKIAVFILLIAIICQSFSTILVLGDYYLNTAEYAALCINKGKPGLHCNGQCQMAQKMQDENASNKNTPHTSLEIPVIYFTGKFPCSVISAPLVQCSKQAFAPLCEHPSLQHLQDIFRPPTTV